MNDRRAPPGRLLTILISVVVCVAACIAYGVMWWNASNELPEIPGLRFGYNLEECRSILAPHGILTIDCPGKIGFMTVRSSYWWQRDRYYECTLKFAQVIRPTSSYYVLVDTTHWAQKRRTEQLKRGIAKVYEQWTGRRFPWVTYSTEEYVNSGPMHKEMERPAR
ncbi:hypothetical protein LBMAG53_19690 [Planctomycetota bacterium]|nr:hypothetical protein LBMAG53_19690 [Planctomycetota bacterium]